MIGLLLSWFSTNGLGRTAKAALLAIFVGAPYPTDVAAWAHPSSRPPATSLSSSLHGRHLVLLPMQNGAVGGSLPRLEPAHLSPDGHSAFSYEPDTGLWIQTGRNVRQVSGRLVAPEFGASDNLPFAWSDDSRLFALVRSKTSADDKGGSHLVAFAPTLFDPPEKLPPIDPAAGPLDGVFWVGSRGLAVAEFATKGAVFERSGAQSDPALAIVDAKAGRLLQRVLLSTLSASLPDHPLAVPTRIDGRIDIKGRAHVVFTMGTDKWFQWNQGSAPHRLDLGQYDRVPSFAISPDLKAILIVPGLNPTGGQICEHGAVCASPTPATGVVAELKDLASGRRLWTLHGEAAQYLPNFKPVFSPNGRHALLVIPGALGACARVALISVRTGAVEASVCALEPSRMAFGFAEGGHRVWVSAGSSIYQFSTNGR